jgi:hypothetical protein
MHVHKDPARHDQLERWLASQFVAVVRAKLVEAGVQAELVSGLTKEIAVGVADLWDGCHGLEVDGEFLSPFLVFASDSDDETVLVRSYDDTGSFLHERVASSAERADS